MIKKSRWDSQNPSNAVVGLGGNTGRLLMNDDISWMQSNILKDLQHSVHNSSIFEMNYTRMRVALKKNFDYIRRLLLDASFIVIDL